MHCALLYLSQSTAVDFILKRIGLIFQHMVTYKRTHTYTHTIYSLFACIFNESNQPWTQNRSPTMACWSSQRGLLHPHKHIFHWYHHISLTIAEGLQLLCANCCGIALAYKQFPLPLWHAPLLSICLSLLRYIFSYILYILYIYYTCSNIYSVLI